MENTRIQLHHEQFQQEINRLEEELQVNDSIHDGNTQQQQLTFLRLTYQLGETCGKYGEFQRAITYFQQVLELITGCKDQIQADTEYVSGSITTGPTIWLHQLKENVLNNLSATHFRVGERSQAMKCLLEAKQLVRGDEDADKTKPVPVELESVLTINYALLLHANGNIEDAIHAATSVVEKPPSANDKQEEGSGDQKNDDERRARVAALTLLAKCWRDKANSLKALHFAQQAAEEVENMDDPMLLAQVHNNLGIHLLESREFVSALQHFLAAYEATQSTVDFQLQGLIKYHIGVCIAQLDTSVELPVRKGTKRSTFTLPVVNGEQQIEVDKDIDEDENPHSASAKDCFLQSETLAASLTKPDHTLHLLSQCGRGETDYFAGDFHTAEAEFSIAITQLKEKLVDIANSDDETAKPTSPQSLTATELTKIHSVVLSYLGCIQLIEGKFDLAESSHQWDLQLAMQLEDLTAQQRALRNLALVYNTTQRYDEALPLWKEAVEIATVLKNKSDLMMAYSGLGIAMKELRLLSTDPPDELNDDTKNPHAIQIFLKQRALAIQLGDKNQHIIAQRHLVSMYEPPHTINNMDGNIMEQRLAECDTLVKLCEQYENLQYRADAYRSLANALTAQLTRLRARGKRFVQAIDVLTQKRDVMCAKYQETINTLKTATAVIVPQMTSNAAVDSKDAYSEEKHPRPPLTQVDVFCR